jgi:hypothetical protein
MRMPKTKSPPLRIISDNALGEGLDSKQDSLGFANYADILARVIRDNEGPLTIGVFGEWGTGKTSLLKLIQKELAADPLNTMIVWFNAWQYEREGHPLMPLIKSLLSLLDTDLGREFLGEGNLGVVDNLKLALKSIVTATKVNISPFGVGVDFSGEKARKIWEEKQNLLAEISTPYYSAFESLGKITLPSEKRIVVLVDDLDRCMPQNALRVLESVKLAMSRPGFAFVVAISPQILHDYLRHRYASQFGIANFTGQQYLEKIIHLPFYLPDNSGRMSDFSKSLLEIVDKSELEQFEEIMPLIEKACRNVPRQAIRFFNAILVAGAMFESVTEENTEQIPLVAFAVDRLLQLVWRGTYWFLLKNPSICLNASFQWQSEGVPGELADFDPLNVLADSLHGNETLTELLFSKPCRDWLANENWRRATSMFQISKQEMQIIEAEPVEPYLMPALYLEQGGKFARLSRPTIAYITDFMRDTPGQIVRQSLAELLWQNNWGPVLSAVGIEEIPEAQFIAIVQALESTGEFIREFRPAPVGAMAEPWEQLQNDICVALRGILPSQYDDLKLIQPDQFA